MGSKHSSDGRMLSLEVHSIRNSSNDDPSHHHDGYNAISDCISSVPVHDTIIVGGVLQPNMDVTISVDGIVAAYGGLQPICGICVIVHRPRRSTLL